MFKKDSPPRRAFSLVVPDSISLKNPFLNLEFHNKNSCFFKVGNHSKFRHKVIDRFLKHARVYKPPSTRGPLHLFRTAQWCRQRNLLGDCFTQLFFNNRRARPVRQQGGAKINPKGMGKIL